MPSCQMDTIEVYVEIALLGWLMWVTIPMMDIDDFIWVQFYTILPEIVVRSQI